MPSFNHKNNEDAIKILGALAKHTKLDMGKETASLSACALHGTLTCKDFDKLIKDLETVIKTLKSLSIELFP